MQTITDLNKKILYRSAKIIYFIILLGLIVKGGSILYERSIYYPYNHSQTRITCQSSEKNTVEIEKIKYGISGPLTAEQKEKIAQEICHTGPTPIVETETKYSDLFLTHNNIFIASEGVMEEKIKLPYFIGFALLLVVGSLIITELLRRIIYYIFLGTFTPKA